MAKLQSTSESLALPVRSDILGWVLMGFAIISGTSVKTGPRMAFLVTYKPQKILFSKEKEFI